MGVSERAIVPSGLRAVKGASHIHLLSAAQWDLELYKEGRRDIDANMRMLIIKSLPVLKPDQLVTGVVHLVRYCYWNQFTKNITSKYFAKIGRHGAAPRAGVCACFAPNIHI